MNLYKCICIPVIIIHIKKGALQKYNFLAFSIFPATVPYILRFYFFCFKQPKVFLVVVAMKTLVSFICLHVYNVWCSPILSGSLDFPLEIFSWPEGLPSSFASFFFSFLFGHASRLTGSWFPGQRLNPGPQQWKYTILNIVPPGNSPLAFLPRWFSGKVSSCQCRRHRRRKLDPWVGKIPWRRRKWQAAPVSFPE